MQTQKLIRKLVLLIDQKRFDQLIEDRDLNPEYQELFESQIKSYGKYSLNIPSEKLDQLISHLCEIESTGVKNILIKLIKLSANPISIEIAQTICEKVSYNSAIFNALADSYQNLEVYFIAADQSKYARSRLCVRLFIESKYTKKDLQNYLSKYGKESAIRILRARKPSDEEKMSVFSQEDIDALNKPLDSKTKSKSKQRKNIKRATYISERIKENDKLKKDMD